MYIIYLTSRVSIFDSSFHLFCDMIDLVEGDCCLNVSDGIYLFLAL